jgi:hypothetical protein
MREPYSRDVLGLMRPVAVALDRSRRDQLVDELDRCARFERELDWGEAPARSLGHPITHPQSVPRPTPCVPTARAW